MKFESLARKMKNQTVEAVIFDMDGLLIDTETHAKEAWQKAAEQIGESFDDQIMDDLIGRHIEDCLDLLSEDSGRDLREINFIELVDNIYLSNFMRYGIDVKHGADQLLGLLDQFEVPRAIATSSELAIAPRKLRLAGLEHYFEILVSGCEVEKSKPAPDIFLRTAEILEVRPEACLVLEDSYNGLQGAKAAGMKAVMIPDRLPPTTAIEPFTDGIFSSLEEATPVVLEWLGVPAAE